MMDTDVKKRGGKRKTSNGSYSPGTINSAIKLVQQGYSIRAAAKLKELSFKTLTRLVGYEELWKGQL